MNEEFLNHYKIAYKDTPISKEAVSKSWEAIEHRLPIQDRVFDTHKVWYGFAVFSLFALLFFAGFSIVQAARPGDTLYPVKILSDKVTAKVLGKPEIVVKKRANDIIQESHSDPQKLEKATDEYKKALQEAASEVKEKDEEKKNSFKQTLQQQEKALQHTETEHPQSQELIHSAVEQTQKTEGEVKGASISPSSQDQQKSNEHKTENHQDEKGSQENQHTQNASGTARENHAQNQKAKD